MPRRPRGALRDDGAARDTLGRPSPDRPGGRTAHRVDRAETMRRSSITTDVASPTERVRQVMRDVERWQEWTPWIRTGRPPDGGPLAVDGRAAIRQRNVPPALREVTAVEPARSFTRMSGGPGFQRAAARRTPV